MTNYKADLLATGSWHGQSCFVVGGGPSLRHFDFKRLDGALTIGTNRAYEFFTPTIMLAIDARFYEDIYAGKYNEGALRKLNAFNGPKVGIYICKHHPPGVTEIKSLGVSGPIMPIERGIFHGNNSGYSAVALALALGANPVYVMGIDLRYDGEIMHHHDGHPEKTSEKQLFTKCIDPFINLSRMPEGRRVKLFNPEWPQTIFSRLGEYFQQVPPAIGD
jgi:hypothetical protein